MATRPTKARGARPSARSSMRCNARSSPSGRTPTSRWWPPRFLHDVGHFLAAEAIARSDQVDDRHELLAIPFLSAGFDEAVTEPVRLHVEAKRFLVRVGSALRPAALAGVAAFADPAGRRDERRRSRPLRSAALRPRRRAIAPLGRPRQAAGQADAAAGLLPCAAGRRARAALRRLADRHRRAPTSPDPRSVADQATRSPATNTERTTGCASSSRTRTRSARWPGSISPRSCRPAARPGCG